MTIGDKADRAEGPELYPASKSMGLYRLESMEEVPAEEIGTDEFPQYGDWVSVTKARQIDGVVEWDEEAYIELPTDLDRQLRDLDVEVGTVFRIQTVQKDREGTWQYSVTEETDPVD